jgi:hypothetical protein
VACGQGHEAEFASYRDKTFDTVLGPVTVSRAWYHCARCGHGLAPRDAELGGDLEGGLDGQRGQGGDEQLADVLVEGMAGDRGADRAGVADAVALAEVGGQVLPAAGVVADGHPPGVHVRFVGNQDHLRVLPA